MKKLSCKLTNQDLIERKSSIISHLKKNVLKKKEFPDGYQYLFKYQTDQITQITDFIKLELLCCDFFIFELCIQKDIILLEISGPEGIKDFINHEIEF